MRLCPLGHGRTRNRSGRFRRPVGQSRKGVLLPSPVSRELTLGHSRPVTTPVGFTVLSFVALPEHLALLHPSRTLPVLY